MRYRGNSRVLLEDDGRDCGGQALPIESVRSALQLQDGNLAALPGDHPIQQQFSWTAGCYVFLQLQSGI